MQKMKMIREEAVTFNQGCELYLNYCRQRNLREATIKHYQSSYIQLYKYIPSDTILTDITQDVVYQFIIDFKKGHTNDMTLNAYARDLKTTLTYLMNNNYMPFFKIKLPKADKEPIETYTDSELEKLLKKPNLKKCNFAEYRNWVIINLLLLIGIRQRSLINIKIKDLDFDNSVIHINVTKNGKPLIIPLNATIISILKEYLPYRQSNNADDFLFCNVYQKQLTKPTVYRTICDYNKARGVITTGMHRFRHTFAKQWILAGGNVCPAIIKL